ncbi:cold shock domain-containing protein [Micromonospora sp. NPDC007271]|uniref:cold shock domain-containing protein n=1 Tax=Micromonospora sp. NPDC007271 TaxID=3154587 RepID=UPI0033DAA0FE
MNRQDCRDTGVVTTWNLEEGWGTIALNHADLTAWVHYSAIVAGPTEYRSLTPGQQVRCQYETPGQDGYPARAVEVTKLS